MAEYTMSPLFHAKFGPDSGRRGYRSPKSLVEIEIIIFWQFLFALHG